MGLEIAEITMEVENHFNITLPGNGFAETYGELLDLIAGEVANSHGPSSDAEARIDEYLKDLLVITYGVPGERIKREAPLFSGGLELG